MVESSVCMNIASIAEAVSRPRCGTRIVSDIFPGRQLAGGLCTRIGDNATGGPWPPDLHRSHPWSARATLQQHGYVAAAAIDTDQLPGIGIEVPGTQSRKPVSDQRRWIATHPRLSRRATPCHQGGRGVPAPAADVMDDVFLQTTGKRSGAVVGCFRATITRRRREMATAMAVGSETHGTGHFSAATVDPDQCCSLGYWLISVA